MSNIEWHVFSAWAYVGQGHSSDLNNHESKQSKSIIVSRSHSGQVTEVAKSAIGPDVNVIPAGGAGECSFFIFILENIWANANRCSDRCAGVNSAATVTPR